MDKKTVIQMLQADFARFHQESVDIIRAVDDLKQDARNYMESLISQIKSSGPGPLLAKTPKLPKKRATRIKAIPENNEMDENDGSILNIRSSRSSRVDMAVMDTTEIRNGRIKRGASVKAADIIKKQQSMTLTAKLRRPSLDESDIPLANRVVGESRLKRPKESLASSEEDEDARPLKQSKLEKRKIQSKKLKEETFDISNYVELLSEQDKTIESEKLKQTSVKRKLEESNEDAHGTLIFESPMRNSSNGEPLAKKANVAKASPQKSDMKYTNPLERISEKTSESSSKKSTDRTTRSSSSIINAQSKKYKMNNIINETMDITNPNETIASIYEDATGKPVPIMNSTMNPNTTVTLDKMMNATVVIEPLTIKKVFNETITIQKNVFKEPTSHSIIKEIDEDTSSTKKSTAKRNSNKKSKKDLKAPQLDELMTDDESSPERKGYKLMKEKLNQPKRVTRSSQNSSQSEDEVNRTPISDIKNLKEYKGSAIKSNYKPTALFSPYAKDSVKKRVEAFEQVTGSPKQNEHDTGGRVTRTKTRALAAASFSEAPATTVAQKLARKSLAKAKKISLAKHAREIDETKENDETYIAMSTKKNSVEQSAQKPNAKTTPLGKSRLQVPSSVSKTQFATPSSSHNHNAYSKAMTGSRGNIVTNVDSFIQANISSASKKIDRAAEEKRRRAHEEDARRKREELLRAQAEEKRRKREEKELKNRLAREAKEKLEHEKRLKAEKEKEEKARLALQMQEKQREEMERKRIAQMQRAMEKEERRKAEEALRLKRLQEQEEQEKLLAEQRRREQEMEKRKQAEQRYLAELKQKKLMEQVLQAKLKIAAQKQVPSSYKIDSDPDEEDSDDESKPKHEIPTWASKNVRQHQLAMQQYIPMNVVLRFFDAKQCTPDLRELFQGIDPKKLKRSSSANWKTPPRYSMMNCSIIRD